MLYFDVEADWKKFQDLRLEITRLEKALNDINVNRSVSETVKLENQLAAARGEMEKMAKTAAVAGYDMEKGMERSLAAQNQLLQDYNSKLIEHRKNLLAAQQTMKDIKQEATEKISIFGTNGKLDRDATAKARQQYISKNAGDAPEVIERETAAIEKLRGEREKLNISIQRSRTEYDLLMKEQQRLTSSAQSVSAGITKFAAALGGAKLIKDFGERMVQTRAQFQSMEAALNTMVGSDKAGQLMSELKDLAKQSPLTMQNMVGAEKTMLGFGISADKTTKYIKALSDVSMGDSGKFNALTLAFSQMSAAGRLMGQDLLQMINAGFNPLEQMSKTTGKSIAQLKDEMSKGAISAEMVQKAFMDATQAGGKFAGMSEATAKTIGGQMSMLNDALDNMFNELGKSAEGFIVSGISKITGLVQSYEEIVPALEAAVAALGMAKVASLAYIKVQEQSAIAAKIYGVSVESATMKQKLSIAVTKAAKNAQLALNAAMKAAPWALAAAAVGALVYAAIKYNQKQKEIHAGETRMAEAMAKTAQKTQAEQIKASLLTSELEKLTEGTDEYNAKKKELVDYAATYDRKLADEIANTTDLTTCYDKLAEAIDKANKKKMAAEFYTSETAQIEQTIANFDAEYREKVAKWYTNDVKDTDVKEYTKRYLEVDRMFKEIQTGLKDGTVRFDLETNKLKGLSKETLTLIHDMQMSWDGGERLVEGIRTVAKTVSVSRAVVNEVMDNTGTSYADLAKDVKNDIDKAQKEIEDSAADIKKNFDKKSVENLESAAKGKKDAIERLRDELKNLLADAQKNGAKADDIKLIQSYLNAMVTETDESGNEFIVTLEQHLDNLINKFQSQIAKIEGQTLDEARKRAHAEWEKAKKELQDAKTLKEYNDAKAKVDATQKSYYALGGDEIEKQKDAQKKFDEELAKMRSDSDKKKLQAKKDSIEKELQLIDFEYQEKLKEYEKQEKELAEKLKKKQITKAQYDSAMGIIGEQRTQSGEDAKKKTAELYDNLVNQYKDYNDKKLDIDKKYEEDKAKLEAVIRDKNATEEQKKLANKGLVKLEQDRNKAQLDLGLENLQNGNDWKMVFDNLNKYSERTLLELKKKLEEVGDGVKENLNPADLQAFNTALENLNSRLMEFHPRESFKAAKANVDEKQELLRRAKIYAMMAEGTEEETEAQKKLKEAENASAEAIERYNRAAENYRNKVEQMIGPSKQIASQLASLGDSSDTLAGDILHTVGVVAEATFDAIENINKLATTSIDSMQTASEAMGNAVEKSSEATSSAISTVEKASVILAIISAVLQIAQEIDRFVDKKKSEAAEKTAEISKMQSAVNDYRMAVLEAQQAEKNWFNQSGIDSLQDSYERGQQALKNYYDTANKMQDKYQEEEGGGFLKKAGNFGTKLGGIVGDTVGEGLRKVGMDAVADVFEYADLTQLTEKAYQSANNDWEWGKGHDTMYNLGLNKEADKVRARDNLRIETQAAKKGFLGIGSKNQKTEDLETWLKNNGFEGELFDENDLINLEAAQSVLDNFGDKLVGQTKETIEELKKAREEYDQYIENLHSYVSDMFGQVTDDMVDALFNWLDTGEDVMDTFEKNAKETFRAVAKDMVKSLANKMIFDDYAKKVAEVYKKSNDEHWSAEKLAEEVGKLGTQLKDDVKTALPTLQAVTQSVAESMDIIGGATGQQSAVAQGFQTMSEDTAGVLEGRFTAVYESNLAIQGILLNAQQNITNEMKIYESIASESRGIMASSLLQLQSISASNEEIHKLCKTMSGDLNDVRTNTKKMAG